MIHMRNVEHGRAIAHKAGFVFNPNSDQVISWTSSEGGLLGGVTFEKCLGNSIFAHIASFAPNWLNRDALWVCCHYPFVQLDCAKVIGLIHSGNAKILAFAQRLGFKKVGEVVDAYTDGDLAIVELHRDDCRWLDLIKPRGIRSNQ